MSYGFFVLFFIKFDKFFGWFSLQEFLVSACERKKNDNISLIFFCLLYVDLFVICQVAQCLESLQ